MRGFPFEALFLLLFAGVWVAQLLLQRAARRRQAAPLDAALADVEAAEPAEPVEAAGPQRLRPATPAAAAPRADAPGTTPPPRPTRRFSRRRLFGSRRQVQDAIVVAAILGPCRAEQPYDAP